MGLSPTALPACNWTALLAMAQQVTSISYYMAQPTMFVLGSFHRAASQQCMLACAASSQCALLGSSVVSSSKESGGDSQSVNCC